MCMRAFGGSVVVRVFAASQPHKSHHEDGDQQAKLAAILQKKHHTHMKPHTRRHGLKPIGVPLCNDVVFQFRPM